MKWYIVYKSIFREDGNEMIPWRNGLHDDHPHPFATKAKAIEYINTMILLKSQLKSGHAKIITENELVAYLL
jgi:hypothetical protein